MKHVDAYDADVDDHVMGQVFIDFEFTLPDIVVRPESYKRLCVSVPSDGIIYTEWSSAMAVEIYPNLPNGDRHERHQYLQALDIDAFRKEESSWCHPPPKIHV
jgi:hypothetical protein